MLYLILVTFLVVVASAAAAALAVASRRHKRGARGEVKLIGRLATIERDLRPEGVVIIAGEQWPARTRSGLSLTRAEAARVRVVGVAGYWLEVEPEE